MGLLPTPLTAKKESPYDPQPIAPCHLNFNGPPQLVVVIDTEEEFDWSQEFSRDNTAVQSLRFIGRVQNIFDEYGITPVYAVDYPVASQPDGFLPLREILRDNRCVIGAHLHPWVNPPFEEVVSRYHSFPGNLPHRLEYEKLRILGECIADTFGHPPLIYKAGRYGTGPHTATVLEDQGYEADVSVMPLMDWSSEGGADFSAATSWPYWFGHTRKLLEIPVTAGFTGFLRKWGRGLHRQASHPLLEAFHPVGILARLGLVDKIRLSPEGFTVEELKRLVKTLLAAGLPVFSLSFHSPSVVPGQTPYVTSKEDLEKFLRCLRLFFDFFFGEVGGQATTPLAFKRNVIVL